MLKTISETVDFLKEQIAVIPDFAIILGTGLGGLADQITDKKEISYDKIPNFPVSTVEGHSGKLIFGKLGGKDVLAMQGRFHYYEGYSMKEVTFPVRVFQMLGIKYLFVSNAAGGANTSFEVGDIMLITDHINLFPEHPLRGKNENSLGTRFPDMTNAYDKDLQKLAVQVAKTNNIKLQRGVYVGTQGPTFETPAEYNYFRIIGGDAVGMSTVPEVIVANHANMKVLGFSIITNIGVGTVIDSGSHDEVQNAASSAQPKLCQIIKDLVNQISN